MYSFKNSQFSQSIDGLSHSHFGQSASIHPANTQSLSSQPTQKFLRVKVGVGAKPKGWDLADYVLGRFSTEERKLVDESIQRAGKAVELMISQGVDAAMNEYNKKTV